MGSTFHTCCPTAHSHMRGLVLSASDGIWNMFFSTYSHTFKRVRSNGCSSPVVAHVRPTHHSPFRVLRTSLMPSQPGFVYASPLGSTSTAVRCMSSTSNSSPPDIGRGSSYRRVLHELDIEFEPTRHCTRHFLRSLQLSWKLAATCTRHRPIHLCARFGILQDRIWKVDETAVRLVPKKAEPAHVFTSRAFVTVTLAAFCASSCPTLRRTGSRRTLSWT